MALSIAEASGATSILAYIHSLQGKLYLARNNLLQAIRLLRKAETITEAEGHEMEALKLRFLAVEAMVRLGERADAIALLEDLQTRLMRGLRFREALDGLNLLSRLYEESGSWDEKNRVTQLVHLCGQKMIQHDGEQRPINEARPEIRPFQIPGEKK
jgi:tetratricopeptide (TPR) repeat protein